MLNLFLKTTIRHILKDKLYSFLNIFGLAIGLAAFLYIVTYVNYEVSFDNFHSKADRTYRCVTHAKLGETAEHLPRSEAPLASALMNEIPEVEAATRLFFADNLYTKYENNKFFEEKVWFADPNFFDVFDFQFVNGVPSSALSKPLTVLLTQKAANKYFGNESAIGKALTIGPQLYEVMGIIEDLPKNSHLQFDILASSSSIGLSRNTEWGNISSTYTYVVAKEGVNKDEFEKKYEACLKKYEEQVITKFVTPSLTEFYEQGNYFKHKLQPLSDIHLNASFAEENATFGNKRFLIIFGITGLLILIIACVNFINMSTATAANRAKEIGIKKLNGSKRKNIIFQVLVETFIYVFLSLVVASILLTLALPVLNNFSGKEITLEVFLNKTVLLVLLSTPILISFFAGMYPAFFINRYNLSQLVKGKSNTVQGKSWLRGSLVAVQFSIFIVLIISSITINKQIVFLKNQNPGFEKENVLVLKNMSFLGNQQTAFKKEIQKIPSAINASFASSIPSMNDYDGNPFCDKEKGDKYFMDIVRVDADFLETMQMEIADGRFFTKNFDSEKRYVVINEAAAKVLNWNKGSGKILHDINNGGQDFEVIGIAKNIHIRTLRENAKPLVLKTIQNANYLAIRLHPGNMRDILYKIKAKWVQFNKDAPFDYFFLDETFDAQYKSEEQLAKTISLFTFIAIAIACLGLFGLVAYSAARRTKEIGVRKVNGAKMKEIVAMLNKDFLKWVFISLVIATPVAWYVMNKWLEDFVYRTAISWWVFVIAGIATLVVAIVTVSWQTWRAARRNPVEALRYE